MSAPDFDRIDRARDLIEAGQSYLQVSKALGIARSTLYMWQRDYGWRLPKAGSAQNRPRKPKSAASLVSTTVEDDACERTFRIADELVDEVQRLVGSDTPDAVVQEALLAGLDAMIAATEPTESA